MVRILTATLFLLANVSSGQGEGLSGKARLEGLIAQISQAQASIRTASASFQQTKSSHLLKAPSVARGKFFFAAPDHVRWDYQEPNTFVVLITAKSMVTYRPNERVAEKVELGRIQRKVFSFMSASQPLASLTRHFTVTLRDPGGERDYVIILQPVTQHIKKRIKEVRMVVDRKKFLPVQVSYKETDGDETTYVFTDIRINEDLPPGLFSLDLPAGVRVVELKIRGIE